MLDFYRYPQGTAVLPILKHIDENHDRIITGNQVEMEYKKNRQMVILKSISDMKKPNWETMKAPVILSEAQPIQTIEKNKKEIDKQIIKLRSRMEQILKDPIKNDVVYNTLQRLFRSVSKLNLTRENEVRFEIREFAKKRFDLGYPPRKPNDTSIGDPVNWEWIIYCAKDNNSNVIVVSRDSDYGNSYDGEQFINDWLSQEFKERVNRIKKVTLTNKLTSAFKIASIKVSKKEKDDEDQLIDEITATSSASFQFPNLSASIEPLAELQEAYRKLLEPIAKQQKEIQEKFKNIFEGKKSADKNDT
ncbi:MAG: hypothetical protein A2W23_07655 [Planctomycetes bacterium RBG_16_43_13]|nr:MAG: hypothetical protein A2W23_07655 [Planctomycetes bacterium RBG_16_43_13]